MKRFNLLLLALLISLSLAGCKDEEVVIEEVNTPEALEEIKEDEVQKIELEQIVETCESFYKDKLKEINDGLAIELALTSKIFTDAKFDVKGNSIFYTYTFSDEYGIEDTTLFNQDFTNLIEATKEAIKEESGVRPGKVTFKYLSSEGKTLFEVTK